MQTGWIEDSKLSAGSAAVGVAVVTTLLQVESLDENLITALYCFSYSIPVNAFLFLVQEAKFVPKSGLRSYPIIGAYLSALFSFWAGMVFTITYLSVCAGLIFALTIFLAILLLFFCYESKIKESDDKS